MVLLIFSEPVYRSWFIRQPHDFSKETKELDSLIATLKWEPVKDTLIVKSADFSTKLFSFNPNLATKEQLIELSFTNSLANRIVNYRLKGGKFGVKSDLMKIYGMDSTLFNKIQLFIDLPEKKLKESQALKSVEKEKPAYVKFDLNTADTAQLIKIYGIGAKLSSRIVTYREKLGGFVTDSQLSEVYGLDSVVIKELLLKSFIEKGFQPKLVNINLASEQVLNVHPYIKHKLAKVIVAYRAQHGLFQSLDELKKITLIDEQKFQKIKPYLSINP